MIPTIGIMIGFYILARCAEMIGTAKNGDSPGTVKALSAVAFLVSVLGMLMLLTTGAVS